MSERPKPLVLAILDGWGIAPDHSGNAITRGNTPNMDRFIREYPAMTLYASGNEVGLRFGEMGNSEVGHLNIGAGRVYYQTLPRISKSIGDGSFAENSAFLQAFEHVKQRKSALHLIQIISTGNVHGSIDHLYAMLELAKAHKVKHVYVHGILDGRDIGYNTGLQFVRQLEQYMKKNKIGKLASLSGRYYAMDRDNRWDRIEKAYRAMAEGVADEYFKNGEDAINASYAKEVYDEEFVPTVIGKEGKPSATIQDGDAAIFLNFRPDRARQLTRAFALPSFQKFQKQPLNDFLFVTMTEYEKDVPVVVAYPPVVIHNCLAEVLSKADLTQFHAAETEKYAHITFFLNGTIEDPFPGEERKIIPSPQVPSYDEAPEMSAPDIAKEVIKAIDADQFDVIFCNFANADMVAHTGNMEASIAAVEAVDRGLGKIVDHVIAKGGILLITADHGNAEEVINLQTGDIDKEHSTNPVPFLIVGEQYRGQAGPAGDPPEGDLSLMHPVGMLADVAPTVLALLGVDIPEDMTGRPLM